MDTSVLGPPVLERTFGWQSRTDAATSRDVVMCMGPCGNSSKRRWVCSMEKAA